MKSASVSEFRSEMKSYLDSVSDDNEMVILNRSKDRDVVLISLKEWNSWQETMYLMKSKANHEHLLRSIQQSREGNLIEGNLDLTE